MGMLRGRKNTVHVQDVGYRMEEECISMEEVIAAIAKLKKGKAQGICSITIEMLKAEGRVLAEWLHRIINLMWMKCVG